MQNLEEIQLSVIIYLQWLFIFIFYYRFSNMQSLRQAFSFDPEHSAMVHDIKVDYYQKKMATCSADGRINVFQINYGNPQAKFILSHKVSNYAILRVEWAPPYLGCRIACCGFDGHFKIFKLHENQLIEEYESQKHNGPIQYIEWAPLESQALLAVGSYDSIQFIKRKDEQWVIVKKQSFNQKDSCIKLSWSFINQRDLKLVIAVPGFLTVYIYDLKNDKLIKESQKKIMQTIKDISWRKVIRQISTIVVLFSNRIQFYDESLQLQQQIHSKKSSNNSRIGWSNQENYLNIYLIRNNSFEVDTFQSSVTGKWKQIQSQLQ